MSLTYLPMLMCNYDGWPKTFGHYFRLFEEFHKVLSILNQNFPATKLHKNIESHSQISKSKII